MSKSITDKHWNKRAVSEKDHAAVNIADVSQRDLETEFVLAQLQPNSRILEIGCGNGFLTNILRTRVNSVDAFDYAENMVEEARRLYGEKNNRFFHDNVLKPASVKPPYDAVVCVRVLINLRDLNEQKVAVSSIAAMLRPGGTFVMVEGFLDGFGALNELREKCGLERLRPAAINFYSPLSDLMQHVQGLFVLGAEFHSGSFDFLTRVVYPALVGSGKATGHADFHRQILPVARSFNPDQFKPLARLRGFALTRR